MRTNFIGILALLAGFVVCADSFATQLPESDMRSGKKKKKGDEVAANCIPPTGANDIDIGNTRALIQTGGDMWWNLAGRPRYEIPKESGKHSMFAASLWLGGRDVSGQLKVAAQRYRGQGVDFWTGPLNTQTAEIDQETCEEYDRHWLTTMNQVAEFVAWHQLGQEDPDAQAERFPNYQIPQNILDWPAHGRDFSPYNEAYNLAPFVDTDGDGFYDPTQGDYPRYNLDGVVDCQQRIVDIYGDQNLWWIFNDKGNIHSESQADPIGMEIRAQAFAYATNDAVNNMTFYNYELVNRSSFELTETYFGFFADPDIGNPFDDYVGCDPTRGFGYCYNGEEFDEDNAGALGYGQNPPAIGIDFFQGPFQDNDGKDNCLCEFDCEGARQDDGIPYDGLGVGYGDGIPDNERMGMLAFLYYDNGSCVTCDPQEGTEYYNYLRGFWRDNSRMVYGGNGHRNTNDPPYQEADFMFPGTTDVVGWGTDCDPQENWTEVTAGNDPFDRRFVQSAGPFRLAPGAVNNITVGVVWSRASSGGVQASVDKLMVDNDRTQAMFDNCFDLLDGPDAPQVDVVELDREIILTLSNPQVSNNFNEAYEERDPFIIAPDTLIDEGDTVTVNSEDEEEIRRYRELEREYTHYRFEGYQVFQLVDNTVSSSELFDDSKARLVAQCDIKNDVTELINYPFSEDLNAAVPQPRVENAENDGIRQSFRFTQDRFASGNSRLVNHKTYYFMVIAYAHNEYEPYSQTPDGLDGQTQPYLPSRQAPTGAIQATRAVPHKPEPREGGTIVNANYGDGIPLQRIEGIGNSGIFINISKEDMDAAMEEEPYIVENPTYEEGSTPLEIKVVDPLSVIDGEFTLAFGEAESGDLRESQIYIYSEDQSVADQIDTIVMENAVAFRGERYIPQLGISVNVGDVLNPGVTRDGEEPENNGFIGSEIEFDDVTATWLGGISNVDGNTPRNWIRSGSNAEPDLPEFWDYDYERNGSLAGVGLDDDEVYEDVINGTWAPFRLVTWNTHGPARLWGSQRTDFPRMFRTRTTDTTDGSGIVNRVNKYAMRFFREVDVVFTNDKSKWTRSVVLEAQDDPDLAVGNAEKLFPRSAQSVDKDGNPASPGVGSNDDPESANFISETGMGWFPGYAVDIQTGERLNIAFSEDSYLDRDNGNDMIWNPTSRIQEGTSGSIRFGGKHYIYVFRNNIIESTTSTRNDFRQNFEENRMPAYDSGKFIISKLGADNVTQGDYYDVYRSCAWVGAPLLNQGHELLETDARVKLRVNQSYDLFSTGEKLNIGDELEEGIEYLVEKGPISYQQPDKNGNLVEATFIRGDVITGMGEGTGITLGTVPDDGDFMGTNDNTENVVTRTENGGRPFYKFRIDGLEPGRRQQDVAEDFLEEIRAVPNPYYAYSEYEVDKTDNRVKIINLPERCDIKIYSVNGILVREFKKDDPQMTSIDWDLQNHARIPISSGLYLIHVNVPGVGEKVLKWYGVMRPVDLDAF